MEIHTLEQASRAPSNSPLLLIDDRVENLKLLEGMLNWAGFANLRLAEGGQEGLDALSSFGPHLIILDLMMPKMSGYEFLRTVRQASPNESILPILVFTADLNPDAKIRALELGASDFLTKPGDPIEIKLRVQHYLRTRKLYIDVQNQNEALEAMVVRRTEHLAIARRETVEVLSMAGEYRDDNTGQHSNRVGAMSAAIAAEMGLDSHFVDAIRLVAPLHDIGKIAVSDYILRKAGKLSPEESETMKGHVTAGAALLAGKSSPLLQLAREIVLYHHERWDGTGYVNRLAGESIPIGARITTAADTYDAMTNDRPYRKARSKNEAMNEIVALSGKQFDPRVVEAMCRLAGSGTS